MRTCTLCGYRADYICIECRIYCACILHIEQMWTGTCHDVQPHIFVQIYQPEGVKTLRSTTPTQAGKEGQKFANLMKRVFVVKEHPQFGDVAALAQYIAIDVLNYRDAELANAYVSGFVSSMTGMKTAEELEREEGGTQALQVLQNLLQKALEAPKEPKES